MINKKKSRRFIITSVIAGVILLSPLQSHAMIASEVEMTNQELNSNISPFAINTGWRYKSVNGNIYKRLYNYDTGKWIGDWIRVN